MPKSQGLASDSRLVHPGDLFVALAGGTADGHKFIPAALEAGAVAVVGTKPLHDLKVPYLQVNDSRMALPHLAAAFYGYPARKLTMIGVTGYGRENHHHQHDLPDPAGCRDKIWDDFHDQCSDR